MSIIYFDICSIPLFLIILFICYSRKMNRGTANQLFIAVVLLSLFSAIADLGMEIPNNMAPLSEAGRLICSISTYVYLILRNATNVVLLLFLLALTRTTFLLKSKWAKIAYAFPYACIIIMLIQNPFTHNAFTIAAQSGYARGPLMYAFYGIALVYGLVGLVYCVYCRRYLPFHKWMSLLAIYVLGHIAVFVQFFYPQLLLEMFCTAIGLMLVTLAIMRPEERMDIDVGMLSWSSYRSDLKNILLSGDRVQIIVIRLTNSREMRNFLGDHEYNGYLLEIANGLRSLSWKYPRRIDIYYERPEIIYIIADAGETKAENLKEHLLAEAGDRIKRYSDMGFRFVPQICLIRCPEDLKDADDIINLGHKFHKTEIRQPVLRADEILRSRTFAIEARIEEILDRAIKHDHIEMYYQPIYDVRSGRFRSAEALARLIDPEYGMISPAVFIPAAETQGLIIPIGDAVLEQVFRFISEHDLNSMGLSYIEVNLSVAQCMEKSLPEKIGALQRKYNVNPGKVNLEITETTFENISDIMLENVNKLIRMGYSFALDDYGIGYSSIQRVNHIPLKLIKIDKSLVDEISSSNGRRILEHTVRMMQSIGKRLVAEGAETAEMVDMLKAMNCDYIQGYFFSRPLPAADFVKFAKEHNDETGE